MTAATWGCYPAPRRSLASCLTRGDVCHVHVVPRRPAIYRVAWSLFERGERPATGQARRSSGRSIPARAVVRPFLGRGGGRPAVRASRPERCRSIRFRRRGPSGPCSTQLALRSDVPR